MIPKGGTSSRGAHLPEFSPTSTGPESITRRDDSGLERSSTTPPELWAGHPRPEPQDTSEEEDGRRLRFALPDTYPDNSLLYRLSHPNAYTNPPADVEDGTSLSPAIVTQRLEVQRDSVASHNFSSQYIRIVDDDALAVDDYRRSYDFVDFMDRWRLQCLSDEQRSTFKPSIQSSEGAEMLLSEVTPNEMRERGMDMQGLQWDILGPERRDALKARALLHPSRQASVLPQRKEPTDRLNTSSELHYHYRAFYPKHRARFSHYQLRNVLATSCRNDVFYATGDKVLQTSLSCPTIRTPVMDLSNNSISISGFRVTCLAASQESMFPEYMYDKILLAGGFNGEYPMLNLDSEKKRGPIEGFVTHEYDGLGTHAHFSSDRHSGLLRAILCSNDSKMRVMDTRTTRFIDTFSYPNAINCSAPSPDSRLRVLVGDSLETLVTDADKGSVLVTLKEHNDHGFACSWSADGRYLSTGAQDNKVLIWDARNWALPLHTLQCVMSCARSLRFTDDGALVVAEEDHVVSIYDTKNVEMRQDIRFFGSIAGAALINGGDEIVIVNADKTVGGLLSFRRIYQGLNRGTYGERLRDCNGNITTLHGLSRRSRAMRQHPDLVPYYCV